MGRETLYEDEWLRAFVSHPGGYPLIVVKGHYRHWCPWLAMRASTIAKRKFGAKPEDLQWSDDPTGHPTVKVMKQTAGVE